MSLSKNPANLKSRNERLLFPSRRDFLREASVQKGRPTAPEVNWLAAPAGEFKLILRTYLPEPAVLKGIWKPPALKRTT